MEHDPPKRKPSFEPAASFLKRRTGGRTGAGLSDFLDKVRDIEPAPGDTLPPDLVQGPVQ